jgi:hypothetical protein
MRRFKKIRTLRRGAKCAALAAAMWAAETPARADLLGLYTFDDGTAGDSSSYGNHGDVFGGTTPVPFGGSDGLGYMNFNGTNSVIHTPLELNADTNPRFTMGAWARIPSGTAAGTRQMLASDDGGWDRALGTDTRGNGTGAGDTNYRWTGFTGGGPLGNTTPVAGTEDTWMFFAAVYDVPAGQMQIHVDNNVFTSTPTHGVTGWNLFIGANPLAACCAEYWVGDIDNVFAFNEALTTTEIDAIRTNGPAEILSLRPQPPRVLIDTWDFESGDLGDFSVVPGTGTAFDQQPVFGDNLAGRNAPRSAALLGGGIQGDWFVGSFDLRPTSADPVGTQGDGVTGVIESAPFVLLPGAQFELSIGGGRHAWDPAWDPDTNPPPVAAGNSPTTFNVERLVGPDDWEVILTATGKDNEVTNWVHLDASAYAGETVRLRIYDLHSGGWGHINVDDVRYYSTVAEPSTCVLAGIAGLGLAVVARRRRKASAES